MILSHAEQRIRESEPYNLQKYIETVWKQRTCEHTYRSTDGSMEFPGMARQIHASPNVHNGNTEVLSWSSENIFFSRVPIQAFIYMLSSEYVYLPLWYCKDHIEIGQIWE